ncbi:ATP-binding protein [Microbacter margulisiae]|uniref:NAD-dependent dihydropyrimidine dehydrogenase PreA subunit n=1 Tax=Microbacter margulisiae TaxID=1350067 RepID=A0A7W5H1I2_9PORP|nr:4Fe-4S dicluster domain-containing protein [Microbacter margulisiae]MBB3186392.1 NAD-dependent dihydropyrimidine dehydrogenase PreA subunit [Microbacter margulisiae]
MTKRIPTIHADRCHGCGDCVEVCHQYAIALVEQPFPRWKNLLGLPLKYKAALSYPQACTGCGHCVTICRHRAIQIEKIPVSNT